MQDRSANLLTSTMNTHKETHRVFWLVKGYITTDSIAQQCYNSYVKRLWYNTESFHYEEGFEEEYNRVFLMGVT